MILCGAEPRSIRWLEEPWGASLSQTRRSSWALMLDNAIMKEIRRADLASFGYLDLSPYASAISWQQEIEMACCRKGPLRHCSYPAGACYSLMTRARASLGVDASLYTGGQSPYASLMVTDSLVRPVGLRLLTGLEFPYFNRQEIGVT
jgi:hypothetical protein